MNCFSFFLSSHILSFNGNPTGLQDCREICCRLLLKRKSLPFFFSLVLVFCQRLSPLLLFTSGSVTAFSLRVASKRNEKGCPPLLTHVFLSHYEADSINVKFHCQFVLPVSGCMTVAVLLYTRGNERLDSENSQAQINTICVMLKASPTNSASQEDEFFIFLYFFFFFLFLLFLFLYQQGSNPSRSILAASSVICCKRDSIYLDFFQFKIFFFALHQFRVR